MTYSECLGFWGFFSLEFLGNQYKDEILLKREALEIKNQVVTFTLTFLKNG